MDARPPPGVRRHIARLAAEWDLGAPGQLWQRVDATVVFADVSGFTALTERLAKRGRIGAEELVETLNRVFGSMLDTARAWDGELLKFGGDALLFLFTGDDHAPRACSTAIAMRQTLRDAAAVPTSVGRLRLSMSVGVRSGDVDAFLVGAPHRELVLVGPAATETALLEKVAEAGEILVSPATAAALPANAVVRRHDDELRLRSRAPLIPPADPMPDRPVDEDVLRTLFPPALGDVLAAGVPEPEHRVATIAFIRFSGTDALMAGAGPPAVADALDVTLAVIEEAFLAEGITMLAVDLDADGGKVFAGSGVPHASEDDEGRMLRALRRIVDNGTPLALQLGVNRGHVFAAEVGTAHRAAYSAMGDTTNTAARIAAKAPEGVLYAHPSVLEHSRTLFAAEPAGSFLFKGKSMPTLVYDVGEELGTRAEKTGGATPFVGRRAELATARALADTLAAGAGGVLTIAGAAGLGKTRLLHEVLDRCGDVPVLGVRAEPYGVNSAYRVFRDPVRELVGVTRGDAASMLAELRDGVRRLDPDLDRWLPLIGDVTHVAVPTTPEVEALDPRYRAERTAAVIRRLVERAHPGSLVVVAEDAQWTDDASSTLLAHLVTATGERPWLALVARRDVDGGFTPPTGKVMELAPFDADSMRHLVQAATETTPLRPHEVDAIVARASGNPLFAEELTHALQNLGSLEAIPDSLQAAIAAQIDALELTARRVLRYTSVLGRSFRRGVLDEILRSEDVVVDDATWGAVQSFLEADGAGRLRFRNGAAHDVTYDGLAYRLRGRLHRSAGLAVERLSSDIAADADTLSMHFSMAGDPERTWRYALLAADRARRASANADAAVQYERALDAARRLPAVTNQERRRAWTDLGDVRELAGVFDGALDAYRQASRLIGDDAIARAQLHVKRARARERSGEFSLALREVSAGRRLLDAADDPTSAELRARLGAFGAIVRIAQERPVDALRRAEAAVAEARIAGAPEPLANALVAAELAAFDLGRPGDGQLLRDAMAIFVELGDVRMEAQCLGNLGFLTAYRGEWDEATRLFWTCGDAFLRLGDVVGAATSGCNVGELLVNQGRYAEAEVVLRDAARVMRGSRFTEGASQVELQIARSLVARDRLDEAVELLERVVAEFTQLGQPASVLEAVVVAAECDLRRGDPGGAIERLERGEETAGAAAEPVRTRLELMRAKALDAAGREDDAVVAVVRGLDAARRQHLAYEEALLVLVSAELGATQGDVAEAIRVLDGLGVRRETGSTGTS